MRLIDPCGTARLSKDIEQGAVGPDLRIHGTRNLRVVDASIIPVIPDCRIQNAVYMIGEKVNVMRECMIKSRANKSLGC